jgi:hypothetical protein
LPFGEAQLAWSCDSGVAARGAGEPGDAAAGFTKTDAPTDEKKKRRLIENALADIFLDTFDISAHSTVSALFRFNAPSRVPAKLALDRSYVENGRR